VQFHQSEISPTTTQLLYSALVLDETFFLIKKHVVQCQFPKRPFPEQHFPEQHFPKQRFPNDVSPNGISPNNVSLNDISPNDPNLIGPLFRPHIGLYKGPPYVVSWSRQPAAGVR
jgi:hypothetical protein